MAGLEALIAAGAQIAGAGINAGASYWNRQNDLALLQYQNKYNSPLEQMKRGIAAGINPNALAQGIAGSPGYGNMAAADAASLSNAVPNDIGTQIGNSVNSALNAEMVKANIKNTNADTKGKELENKYNDSTMEARIQQALDSGAITAAEAEKARLYLEKYPEFLDTSLEEMRAKIDETYAQTDKIRKDIDRIDQEIKESDKRIEKLEQDIKTSKSQEAKNYAEVALTKEKTKNQQLLNDKQELENHREELTGSATGTIAAYMDKADKEGKENADKWLEENMAIANKVIENSSESSAQGAQNVYDNTPQGQVKKMYQDQMNKELADIDKEISKTQKMLRNESDPHKRHNYQKMIDKMEDNKRRVTRKYRNKMRRVDKGMSGGLSVLGTGGNIGG